ncbi:MAG: EamA family transporter [Candidatus Micrarchaeota archaeon]|nr:EamA family transporter [Candidatus Micrarchaeota archaeon]MDE1847383.1 EamA family transporter [Candidatus Micrarchaeota archaeon]MDE1863998.1 EamA family transporter [Candidatus Micrarchaeota archaeon]
MLGLLYIVSFTLVAALLAAAAQYLFKSSIKGFSISWRGILSLISNRKVIAGFAVYIIALGVYIQALRYGELSLIYPIFASVFIFVLLISRYKLKEKMGFFRIAGIGLIVLGIILTALTF